MEGGRKLGSEWGDIVYHLQYRTMHILPDVWVISPQRILRGRFATSSGPKEL